MGLRGTQGRREFRSELGSVTSRIFETGPSGRVCCALYSVSLKLYSAVKATMCQKARAVRIRTKCQVADEFSLDILQCVTI